MNITTGLTTVVEPVVAESVEEELAVVEEALMICEQRTVEKSSKESTVPKARCKKRKKNNGVDDKNE